MIFQENDFEFFIDPDGDNHEYYEFAHTADRGALLVTFAVCTALSARIFRWE